MNNEKLKTYRLIIKGKVQGVGFRHWFSDLAISLGLNGYVQNLNNKDEVEAIIQGNIKDILNITEKSKNGPEMSLVEGVIPNQIISNVKYSGFIVKYDNN
jgi:Acylphosphatases